MEVCTKSRNLAMSFLKLADEIKNSALDCGLIKFRTIALMQLESQPVFKEHYFLTFQSNVLLCRSKHCAG